MCGIFGVVFTETDHTHLRDMRGLVKALFLLSESRGKEASGLAISGASGMMVIRAQMLASELTSGHQFTEAFGHIKTMRPEARGTPPSINTIIGHSRLVTNGRSDVPKNNQPVVKMGAVLVHNGIVTNVDELWHAHPSLERDFEVDSEILIGLIQEKRAGGSTLIEATNSAFAEIEGSASIAMLFRDIPYMLLATNTGSLYTAKWNGNFAFASENYILKTSLGKGRSGQGENGLVIRQIRAGNCCILDLRNLNELWFRIGEHAPMPQDFSFTFPDGQKDIIVSELPGSSAPIGSGARNKIPAGLRMEMKETWRRVFEGDKRIRRCSRCLMPETTPFIHFDVNGVCNFCHLFDTVPYRVKGEDRLREMVEPYRRNDDQPDCIVGLSGGRDSTYGLHYIKTVLGMNPIAFTYDWGMVNDLARRNESRICGKLGIEHIIVSADIARKRDFIRRNLIAWMSRPELGMIPILMAGDKAFYYYFHKIRKQTGIRLFFFCGGHQIEETPFKYGFCGVNHGVTRPMENLTGISSPNKIRMVSYFAKNYLENPLYLNRSIPDIAFAYYSTYLLPDDYVYLYHYIEWDEEEIVTTIRDKYNWESSEGTRATWRIGDGTAALYNYMYLAMAGFTEHDSFRSYQVRQGKITRDEGLRLLEAENMPRFEEIEWYSEAVGVDVEDLIHAINTAPKLYHATTKDR